MRVDWARSLIENLEIPGYVLDRHRGIRTRAGIDANGQFKKNACKQDHPLTGYDYIAARRMLRSQRISDSNRAASRSRANSSNCVGILVDAVGAISSGNQPR